MLFLLAALVHAGPYDQPLLPDAPARASAAEDPFDWSVTSPVLSPGGAGRVQLTLSVPEGTVVYRDQVEVTVVDAGGLIVGAPDLPPGRVGADPANGGDPREQYDTDVVVYLPVQAPPEHPVGRAAVLELSLRHQGCRGGLCYSPATVKRQALVPVRDGDEATSG